MTAPTFYTPTNWIDTSSGNTPLSAANLNKIEQGIVNAFLRAGNLALNPTVIRTGSFTLSYNDFGRFDCSAQTLVSSLPTSAVGAMIGVKKTDSTANTARFNPAAGDTIDGSSSPIILTTQNESRILIGISGGWTSVYGQSTVPALDLRYAPLGAATLLQTPPVFYATQTAAQSIANTTFVPLTWPSEVVDSNNGHSTSSQTSRYVCQQAGWYSVGGVVNYVTQNQTGIRAALLYKNGTEYGGGSAQILPTASQTRVVTPTVLMQLAVNDYVELVAYQSSGVTTSTEGAATTGSSFSVFFIRS